MSMGSLTAELQVNGADVYTSEMIRAADATQHTAVIIHEQRAAWSQLAASAIPAVGSIASAGLSLAGTLKLISHQKAMITSATAPLLAAGNALMRYSSIGLRVGSMVMPQLKGIAMAASLIRTEWAILNSDFAKDVTSKVLKTFKSDIDTVRNSSKSLATTLRTSVADSIFTVQETVKSWATEFGAADAAAMVVSSQIRGYMETASWAVKGLDEATKEAVKTYVAFNYILHSGEGAGAASEFLDQGAALVKLQEETKRVIALQEQQRAGFQLVANMQAQASAEAVYFQERMRIGSIQTLEALQAELTLQQENAAGMIFQGATDETSMNAQAGLFAAIEQQRAKIESGEAAKSSPIEALIQQARNSVDMARSGQEEFAIGTAMANGATAEQVRQLRELQTELQAVTGAQEAARIAEDARVAAEQQTAALRDQGIARIAALKDQVDLLTKSATAADIAMREMTRQGFTMDQVAEVGRLTEEIQALQQTPEKASTARTSNMSASLRGSSEAASILLRGVGGKSMEQIAQKQLTATQQLIVAVKSNKSEPMTVADF